MTVLTAVTIYSYAVPAYRGWQTKTQPDGTTITVRQMGDEFFHYWENEAGQQVAKDAEGWWRVQAQPATQSAVQKRKQASRRYNQNEPGKPAKVGGINLAPRGLVILVNFSDVTFRAANTQSAMSDLMNSTNYTYDNATGSVREFFKAQSGGAYVPDFDVVGPFNLDYNRAHYGANDASGDDELPGDVIVEACQKANASGVDFTLYNNDGDTYVDFVYVIYAGEGEADSEVNDALWPMNWTLASARSYNNCSYTKEQSKFDGLYINNFAFSGELRGGTTTRCAIGTIAHEFGHVLGLPDYYVTSKTASNYNKKYTPGSWHIMDYGSYNNDGRTPPNYTPHDKYFFGWSTPTLLAKDEKKNCTLTATYGSAYQITGGTTLKGATASDRVWYIENRQKSGWDEYLPGHGMVAWEVTYNSSNWNSNAPNNSTVGYTVVTANNLTRPYTPYTTNDPSTGNCGTPFPGTSNITSWTPATGCAITNITESAGNITFKYNGGVVKTKSSYEFVTEHCTAPDDGEVDINDPLSVVITPASGYSLADASCWTVEMGGTPLTYGTDFTYTPATNTFYIASLTDDIVIMAEAKAIHTVTWSVNGVTTPVNFVDGATLVLPSTPSDCSGSGGKKFVGWTAQSTVSGSAPADLFTTAGSKTVTADITYYAVYATASSGGGSGTPEKASSITAGDQVVFVCESDKMEMTSISTVGEGTAYTTNPAGTYAFTVEAGSSEGTFAFKNGTDYISWSSGNSLAKSTTKNASSSWNVAISSGNANITNAGTPGRKLRWNHSSPRFACYTSDQTAIQLYKITGGTSYSDYSLTCSAPEPCANQVTLSKGTPANGSFNISKTGAQDNCAAGGLVVTVSGITPAEGYEFGAITQTGIVSGVTIDQVAKTVTYTKDVKGTSTINVTFNALPTYAIRFFNNGAQVGATQNLIAGAVAVKPSDPTPCTGDYTFVGWWTAALAEDNTTAETWVTDFTVSGAQDYYAVYSKTEGGGPSTPATLEASYSSHAGWTESSDMCSNGYWILCSGATLTSPVISDLSTVTSITFTARTYGGSSYNTVNVTTGSTSVGSATASSNSMVSKTINVSGLTGSGSLVFSSSTTSSANGPGINNIVINYSTGGGGTTYYTTSPSCVECTNKVTLTKGTPSNGSFTLDKADGEYDNCATGGLVVHVSDITPAAGYQFSAITQTGIDAGVTIDQVGKTVTYAKDVTGSSTINVTFTLIPTYTVNWYVAGTPTEETKAAGVTLEGITAPDENDCDGSKVFMGWTATSDYSSDDAPADLFTDPTTKTMPVGGTNYYAVFADEEGGAATLTKMVAGNTLANGDKIVIVAHETTVALYQETANTSYVQKWTFDNNVETVAADDKKWITVSTATGGWYLGDATNGYLNNSSNSLYCDNDQSIWTLNDNSDGTFNLIGSSGYYLSYRSDLTESNKLWRGGGTNGSNGVSDLDIYKYSGGSTSYSGYTTSCVTPTEVTVTFNANEGEGTMTPQVIDYNTATALNTNTFTREGYTFLGWATSNTATVATYTDGASVTLKKNTTLYAVWQIKSHNVNFTPDPTGAIVTVNSESTSPQSANYGTTVTIAITPATHYSISSVTATGATSSTNISLSGTGNTRTFTMPDEDVNVTVVMTAETTYTVTWSMNGDESTKADYYEGQAIVFPATADGCDGKTFMGWSAVTVPEQDDAPAYTTSATMGTENLIFYAVYAEASGSVTPTTIFTETFNSCDGSGGNDGVWSGSIGQASIVTDNSGWSTDRSGGADACLRVGTGSNKGYAITPALTSLSGTATLTFKAAAWAGDNRVITLSIESTDGATISPTSITIKDSEWDTYTATISNGTAETKIGFEGAYNSKYRFFLDDVVITSGSTTYSGYTTTCGAGISAQNIGWITSAQGKTVKRVIPVSAKNFDDVTTLTATCANSNFQLTLGESAVPAGTTGLTTTLTVEYTPTAESTVEANVDITLSAGDKTRTITVSGRSVPDDFLLITKKNDKWYALPANMTSGSGEYDGVEVSPNDATTPTAVPVSPSTLIYNLASVASSCYADYGNLVRLVGNNNKCLWGNTATGATKVNIQNYAALAESNGVNYEWDLKTTDGVHYFVESPCNAEYAEGRRLAYGTKFGMYKEETVFFIVRAGCSSQPGEIVVSPRRVDATFSWVSNTTQMHIDLYTNSEMTEGHLSATASSSPYVFNGLAETTDYWYKLTPGEDTDCAVTGTFKTTGPIIDIVEWKEDSVVLFIDKGDINPVIVIDGQEEHGSITGGGGNATELFFSKYFEGSGDMKLVAIFNGTDHDIDLSDYKLYTKNCGTPANESALATSSFGGTTEYPISALGTIKAGHEIVFFTRPLTTGTQANLSACSVDYLNDMATHKDVTDNPRWIECNNSTKYGGSKFPLMQFNGNDAICLEKNDVLIDVIGATGDPGKVKNCANRLNDVGWSIRVKNMDYGKSVTDEAFDYLYEASTITPSNDDERKAILNGFGINIDDEYIDLTTARCILFRDKRVVSGDSAVTMNDGAQFVTCTSHIEGGKTYLPEWNGRVVCMDDAHQAAAGVDDDSKATCNSYKDLGAFNFTEYYIDWSTIDPGQTLDNFTSDPDTKEYTIPIDNMRQYACLKLRFQLKLGDEVLTEAAQQVPIVVKGDVDTNDPLFSELVIDQSTHSPSYSHSLARCADCDVVVLGAASLTKGSDTNPKDVPEVGNVKVYPGGKLIVPTGTTYTMKSLALRRQEDVVASADVQGTITFKAPAASPAPRREEGEAQHAKKAATGTKSTYFDLRIDPTNWHFISLPYDVNVSDIRFANPEETAIPVLGTDYLLQWYDGDRRAATKNDDAWEPVAADATLKAGLGYIFALPGSGKVKREFRFPMDNEVITLESANKTASPVYGYGCDQPSLGSNHKGWNLVGAPYLTNYLSDLASPLRTGKLIEDHTSPEHNTPTWDGAWTDDGSLLRYIAIPINNGWDYYYQEEISGYELPPFTSYFVQIDGTDPTEAQVVGFNASRVIRSSIVRRDRSEYEEEEDTHPVWCAINLTNPQGETDKTTVLISNDFTDNYDMMNDMVKMRGSYYSYYTRPVLASRNNEGEMAFNALPDSSALAGIPLNFFAAGSGSYTISFNERYGREEVKAVMLLDKNNNQWYNLLDEPYSFTTNRVDDKNRFVLSVRVERKKPQTPTDIVNPSVMGDGSAPRKILINNRVYILRGGKIYDMTGKQLLNL